MLIRTSELENLVLAASDGEIGRCRDFLFDDEHWTVRYMEANTGKWLFGRRVLISPAALGPPDLDAKRLPVELSKDKIEKAPGIETDQPVSRQYEIAYARYFGYGHYWAGGAAWGAGLYPRDLMLPPDRSSRNEPLPRNEPPSHNEPPSRNERDRPHTEDDPHLRSAAEVAGYTTHAIDGDIGAVDDLVVDTETWSIVMLSLDTRRWLPGRKVLMPVAWATSISWVDRKLDVDVTKEAIRSAPPLEEPITAGAINQYFAHFGKDASDTTGTRRAPVRRAGVST